MKADYNWNWVRATIGICLIIAGYGCSNSAPVVPVDLFFPDGSWVLYDVKSNDSETGELSGSMKVSVVGHEKINGVYYFWIEMNEKYSSKQQITKFLTGKTDVLDFSRSFRFWGDVKKIIIQDGDNPPQEVQELQLKKFIPSFVESKKTRRFGKAEDLEPVSIENLGTENLTVSGQQLPCTHYRVKHNFISKVNLGFIHLEDITESNSEYWTSESIPFGGLVKVIHKSSTLSYNKVKPEKDSPAPSTYECTFMLNSFGKTGAATEITKKVEVMQAPVFPFLKDKQMKQTAQNTPTPKRDEQDKKGIVPLKKQGN